ncbi:MAG: CPBP family glutamic-type intramembrane protease [Candidatus Moraniibacteriota bacterium]
MLATLSTHRRFIVTGILIFFSLGFLGVFTESDRLSPVLQGLIVSVAFFLVIPVFYSKMVLKESLKNIGWQKGDFGAGVFASIVSIAVAGGIVVGLARFFPGFHEQYIFPALVEKSFFWFVFYELVLVTFTVLLYEVFFRGLVQLSWLRAFGMWSILIQTVLFFGLLFLSQDIVWQAAPLLIFCPFAGFIAYRSQSVWYSSAASWVFLFLTDIFFLIFH